MWKTNRERTKGTATLMEAILQVQSKIPQGPNISWRTGDFDSATMTAWGAWEESVVVFREGLASPVRSLLVLVNTMYAVLVLRGDNYYFLQ